MPTITAHCIVKNEENFVGFAIASVINAVDKVLVYDTGSTDATVEIIEKLVKKYPEKIHFEQKGPCNKEQHTVLRQTMIAATTTDWFMILDGDEIWTERGLTEMKECITQESATCLVVPFYLCVGDIFHQYYRTGDFTILGRRGFFSPRVIRKHNGVRWLGEYNQDALVFGDGVSILGSGTHFMQARYWHVSHLKRSSQDQDDYSSGGSRRRKQRLTYFWIGRAIAEPVPEVFTSEFKQKNKVTAWGSLVNFVTLGWRKLFGLS